jgi:hypothetical protein
MSNGPLPATYPATTSTGKRQDQAQEEVSGNPGCNKKQSVSEASWRLVQPQETETHRNQQFNIINAEGTFFRKCLPQIVQVT